MASRFQLGHATLSPGSHRGLGPDQGNRRLGLRQHIGATGARIAYTLLPALGMLPTN